jgi:hypothetical protein
VYVKFFFKLGKMATETLELLQTAYSKDGLPRTTCSGRFTRYKEGRTSTGMNKEGRVGLRLPKTKTKNVTRVRVIIVAKSRLKLPLKQEYRTVPATAF